MNEPQRPGIAGGQTQRLAGASRDASLHEQLYRYAQDFQSLLDDKNDLEERYSNLMASYRQLAENRSILETLVEASHDIHLTTDTRGTILQSNEAARHIAPASLLLGRSLRSLVLPSYRPDFDSLLSEALTAGGHGLTERELRFHGATPDAGTRIVTVRLLPISRGEKVESIHWLMRDMTRAREAEFDSQISSMVFRSATEGIMITDVDGDILAVNPAFSRITGYSTEEVVGRNPRFLKSGIQDTEFYQNFWNELREKGQWQGKVFNRKKSGTVYPEWLTVTVARDSNGCILSYIGVFSDMTRLQEVEQQLAYIAYHDTLTGLPNRLLLLDRTRHAISQAVRGNYPLSALFIDLDGFKKINDTLGHEAGDYVLQETAQRLTGATRDSDTVARLGGDEFVIIANGLDSEIDCAGLATKLLNLITQPIDFFGKEIRVGGSIGIARYQGGMSVEDLLRKADIAMYRAKVDSGPHYHVQAFDSEPPDVELGVQGPQS